MAANKMIVGFLALVLLFVGLMSVFTVKETQLALKLRLGEVISGDFDPGLHFKIPLIHKIRHFDKRIQTLDANPEHFLTSEKKNLIVDSFVKWRIKNVVTFFTSVGGNIQLAGNRLTETIADGLRSEFGKRTIKEVVSGDRAKIMDIITKAASKRAEGFGIEIVDVRIKKIELPTEVSTSVYNRMKAERKQDAKQLRSQGEAEAVRIRANADRKSVEEVALAERDASTTRGEGDGGAADIYAQAYNQNPEFYALYRSLNAYKTTFNDRRDILLIQPDSDFFSYFKKMTGSVQKSDPSPLSQRGETPPKEGVKTVSPQPLAGEEKSLTGSVQKSDPSPLSQKGETPPKESVETVSPQPLAGGEKSLTGSVPKSDPSPLSQKGETPPKESVETVSPQPLAGGEKEVSGDLD
jgi:membrane protease subunit HflC